MAPQAIADELAASFPSIDALLSVTSVNGYLNFKANPQWLANVVLSNEIYVGSALTNSGKTGDKVLIEHTSANPNGPFHVGRARNAILGDTLVRLHRLHGDDVRAEYYVDDMGKQVGVLAWALENLEEVEVNELLSEREPPSKRWLEKADHQRVRWYQAAQILRKDADDGRKAEIEQEIGSLVHASEHGDVGVLESFESAYTPVLDGMLATLSRLGISYDTFTKESTFVVDGTVAKLMEHLMAWTLQVLRIMVQDISILVNEVSKGRLNSSIEEEMAQVFTQLGMLPIICGNGSNQIVLSTSLEKTTNCKQSKSDLP